MKKKFEKPILSSGWKMVDDDNYKVLIVDKKPPGLY